MKTVKKKQKHKSKGNVRTITKQVKNDSFFNFFDPPPISDDPEADVDPETQVKTVENILKGSLDLISSPLPSVRIQESLLEV